jgi:hypothetical protein
LGSENLPHYYAQCSKRSDDEYSWCKDISNEVCNLPKQH